MMRYYTDDNANVHRGVHCSASWRPTPTRAAREKVRRVLQRRQRARDHLHAQRDRGHQPGGADLRPAACRRRRRSARSRRWSTTRTSCRGSCSARRRARGCGWLRSTTAASCMLDELEALLTAAHAGSSRSSHMSNALGTINPIEEIVAMAHAQRHAGPRRRRPGGVPHAGRRAGARLRLLRRYRA